MEIQLVPLGARSARLDEDQAQHCACRDPSPEDAGSEKIRRVSVDANGAYRADDRGHLAALRSLDSIGLHAIEQPFAPDDLAAHATLRRLNEGISTRS